MKRIFVLLLLTLVISQGLVSFAQEDPCQGQVDALNECRTSQTAVTTVEDPHEPEFTCESSLFPACGGTCPPNTTCTPTMTIDGGICICASNPPPPPPPPPQSCRKNEECPQRLGESVCCAVGNGDCTCGYCRPDSQCTEVYPPTPQDSDEADKPLPAEEQDAVPLE